MQNPVLAPSFAYSLERCHVISQASLSDLRDGLSMPDSRTHACSTARLRALAAWFCLFAWAALKASAVPQLRNPQLLITWATPTCRAIIAFIHWHELHLMHCTDLAQWLGVSEETMWHAAFDQGGQAASDTRPDAHVRPADASTNAHSTQQLFCFSPPPCLE